STYVRDLPVELEGIVIKLLSLQREDRFPSGRELASAIARALLQKQELVDASVLEATIAELVVRENTHPGLSELPEAPSDIGEAEGSRTLDLRTQAAVPLALSSLDGPGTTKPPAMGPDVELEPSHEPATVGPREVRHVALVSLRLHGLHAAS